MTAKTKIELLKSIPHSAPPMSWHLGTIGFGYDDWAGPFYPKRLKPGDRLAFYANHFNAVELDTTFHATPDLARVRRWASAVPDTFRFAVKTPRAITHEGTLDDAVGPMREFLDTLREFGPKLGPVLLQFAPAFSYDSAGSLDAFLTALPRDVRLAVELRNRSWGKPETLKLLRSHGACLVSAEYLTRPGRLFATADFLYVRWIGQHGRYDTHEREVDDRAESLKWWADALSPGKPNVTDTFGFMNNDYAGHAPATANTFKRLMGIEARAPETEAEERGLFG